MLPCDLAFGARVFVAQTILDDQEYRFVVLATGESDVYNWWKGDTKRLVSGVHITTSRPLKIAHELNVTPNSLVIFDAITGAYDVLHDEFWGGKGGSGSNFTLHHQRLRAGTMHWHDVFTGKAPVDTAPAARFSDNTRPSAVAQRQVVSAY